MSMIARAILVTRRPRQPCCTAEKHSNIRMGLRGLGSCCDEKLYLALWVCWWSVNLWRDIVRHWDYGCFSFVLIRWLWVEISRSVVGDGLSLKPSACTAAERPRSSRQLHNFSRQRRYAMRTDVPLARDVQSNIRYHGEQLSRQWSNRCSIDV